MRPAAAQTRDPLNVEDLPPTQGMELDYRTKVLPDARARKTAVVFLLNYSCLGLLLTLALRFGGVLLSTPLFLTLMVLWGGLMALLVTLQHDPTSYAVCWLLAGPAIWFAGTLTTAFPLMLVLLVPLVGAAWLAHRVTTHYAAWMHANPYLDRDTRERWRQVWYKSEDPDSEPCGRPTSLIEHLRYCFRGATGHPRQAGDGLEAAEIVEYSHYPLSFFVLLLAYLLAVLIAAMFAVSVVSGMVAVFLFVALLVAWGIYNLRLYDPQLSPAFAAATVFQALVSWLTYNPWETRAPGVFQSPAGPSKRRRRVAAAVVLFTAVAILPAASYFPVGMALLGPGPWVAAASKPRPWEVLRERVRQASNEEAETELTPIQERYLNLSELHPDVRKERAAYLTQYNRARRRAEWALAGLRGGPEASLVRSLGCAITFRPAILASLFLMFLACIAMPPLLTFVVLFATGGRVLTHHWLTLEGSPDCPARYHPREKPSRWEAYAARLRQSKYITRDEQNRPVAEADHLLAGFSTVADYPILLQREILRRHAHITGDTGSGKSALGIAPLLAQLIGRPNSSVVVLDLKGDMALFEAARIGVERANEELERQHRPPEEHIEFRWFTNHPGRCTYLFNPLEQSYMQSLTTHQRVEFLLQSLGLDYGEGYGTYYYSSVHRDVLSKVLNQDLDLNSFARLQDFFSKDLKGKLGTKIGVDKKQKEDASHLYSVVNSLASFHALNVTPQANPSTDVWNERIDMHHVVTRPQVVYFYLPAALEQTSVREVAKLALHSLLTAAVRRGPSKHQVYLFVDEFQQVVSENLEIVLRQARSMGISAILANQTLSDLKTRSADLIPTVQANTRYKQVFAATDLLQQDALIKASGEAIYHMARWNVAGEEPSFRRGAYVPEINEPDKFSYEFLDDGIEEAAPSINENLGPRLMRNDIITATDRELSSIVHVTSGGGYTQFGGFMFTMRSAYHITPNEYITRSNAAWPSHDDHPGTVLPPVARPYSETGGAPPAEPPPAPEAVPAPVGDDRNDIERQIDDW